MENPVIITKRNTDSEGNPISVYLIETKKIFSDGSFIVLKQIPDELERVTIQGYKEVFDVERMKVHEFKVDYEQGIVYFHPKAVGKTIVVEYYGKGYELISASRIFTKYDKFGNVIETLEDVIEKIHEIKPTLDRLTKSEELINEVNENLDRLEILNPEMKNNIEVGTNVKNELEESIANAQDDIATISATGNVEMLVSANEWHLNVDVYEKEITHDLNSENLHVTAKNSDTKEAVTIGYKILDKTRILLKSDEAIPLSIILSASYYHALITTDVDEGEIIRARQGMVSLDSNMARKINYENFSGNTIN